MVLHTHHALKFLTLTLQQKFYHTHPNSLRDLAFHAPQLCGPHPQVPALNNNFTLPHNHHLIHPFLYHIHLLQPILPQSKHCSTRYRPEHCCMRWLWYGWHQCAHASLRSATSCRLCTICIHMHMLPATWPSTSPASACASGQAPPSDDV